MYCKMNSQPAVLSEWGWDCYYYYFCIGEGKKIIFCTDSSIWRKQGMSADLSLWLKAKLQMTKDKTGRKRNDLHQVGYVCTG